MLRKGVYPDNYMDDWEKFNKHHYLKKQIFYSSLNMEDITDADCNHGKKVWEDFEIKNLTDIMICTFKVIHYCEPMYLKTFETNALKYMNLILLIFFLHQG